MVKFFGSFGTNPLHRITLFPGIYPFNSDAIPKVALAPSTLNERQKPVDEINQPPHQVQAEVETSQEPLP